MKKAVFLDRDGTLNPDPGYINDPALFEFFPGVPEALRDLKEAGFLLILVTNQSGIGRKKIKPEELARIHDKMQGELQSKGAPLNRIFVCPHLPDDGCSCRKPSPWMIHQAQAEFMIDLNRSFLIGDKDIDAEMALNAGVIPVLIGNRETSHLKQVFQANDFREAVNWVLRQAKKKT